MIAPNQTRHKSEMAEKRQNQRNGQKPDGQHFGYSWFLNGPVSSRIDVIFSNILNDRSAVRLLPLAYRSTWPNFMQLILRESEKNVIDATARVYTVQSTSVLAMHRTFTSILHDTMQQAACAAHNVQELLSTTHNRAACNTAGKLVGVFINRSHAYGIIISGQQQQQKRENGSCDDMRRKRLREPGIDSHHPRSWSCTNGSRRHSKKPFASTAVHHSS